MRVPFLDLRVTDETERAELRSALEQVLVHGKIVLGPEVEELEKKIASFCGRSFAVGVNSGTDALFLSLKSLGISQGDEVITTALSFVATANAIALTGAVPVFADIRDDLNIDPESVRKLVTPKTKAILPVHYTGKVCRMHELQEIAKSHGLFLVEDASQAFGAAHRGAKAGSFGELACFSMNPMKIFAALGEAGMVVTDRKDLADRLLALRYNGLVNREECRDVSLNGRLDTLQAAFLLKRLDQFPEIVRRRREIASGYAQRLKGVVEIPQEREGEEDIYYTYTIRTPKRDALKAFLEQQGIETKIQHPFLMPQHPVYRGKTPGSFPKAEKLVQEVLCLPVHEKLTQSETAYVADQVVKFCKGGA